MVHGSRSSRREIVWQARSVKIRFSWILVRKSRILATGSLGFLSGVKKGSPDEPSTTRSLASLMQRTAYGPALGQGQRGRREKPREYRARPSARPDRQRDCRQVPPQGPRPERPSPPAAEKQWESSLWPFPIQHLPAVPQSRCEQTHRRKTCEMFLAMSFKGDGNNLGLHRPNLRDVKGRGSPIAGAARPGQARRNPSRALSMTQSPRLRRRLDLQSGPRTISGTRRSVSRTARLLGPWQAHPRKSSRCRCQLHHAKSK